jgi:hypothetical protein
MARTIITTYRIYQGLDEHMWLTSDPPSPVGRYKVVRFTTADGEVWEQPTEWQKASLLPEEYSDMREAMRVAKKLNDEWFLTDPNRQFYKSQQ